MTDRTVIEFCLARSQPATVSLIVHDTRLVEETLAEALYAAKLDWGTPARAFPTVIRKFAKFYTTELRLTPARLFPDRTDFVVDFVSALVSDRRDQQRAVTFSKFLKKHDVP